MPKGIYKRIKNIRWAKNYDNCLNCGTNSKKHNGKGLCITCSGRSRRQDPEKILKNRIYAKKYRDTSPAYKAYLKNKHYLKQFFRNFLKRKRNNYRRWTGGIEIVVEGKRVLTPILPTKTIDSDDTPYKVELFKKLLLSKEVK